jgi:hypothetical protein
MVRQTLLAAALIAVVGSCGPFCGNGKLNLSNARIDPTSYTCPTGSSNARYEIKGAFDADNQSGKKITIKSIADQATVETLNGGNWSISVGEKSGTDTLAFSPASVGANSKTTVNFTLPWQCTNPGGMQQNSYADFKIVLTLKTDSGNFSLNLPDHHMSMAT